LNSMKKIMTTALVCALATLATTGCSSEKVHGYLGSKKLSGEIVTDSRNIKGFNNIDILGIPTVYYTQGSTFSVKVMADKDIVKNVKTYTKGNTLTVKYENSSSKIFSFYSDDDNPIKVYVTSPDLTGVALTGSGDFISEKNVDTDKMKIELKGSGDIDFTSLICDNLSTTLVGSGDIDIKKADALTAYVELVGSGDIDLNLTNAKTTNIVLKGSGDIKIYFDKCGNVSSNLLGTGDISLKGYVQGISYDTLGAGDYNIRQLRVANK